SCEDIVLAQNFFAVNPETPRHDAGRGLLLRGDGKGSFKAVAGQESGLLVYGEQRSVSVADFNHDGRSDVVITQNGAPVKLYRNRGSAPGLRVVLEGRGANRDAIGASIRLATDNAPRRVVTAGSGFASQNATAQILTKPASASNLEITWPNGDRSVEHVAPEQASVRFVQKSK
ncbi:MAG TPA: CRTAC1 family protein, partial [Candidatus Kapabacteria bacterium]|nr:CRTAC1 family protein [Candidatus Kapabacteria bacterium]